MEFLNADKGATMPGDLKGKCDHCGKSLSGKLIGWHSTGMLATKRYEYCSYRCKVRHAKKQFGYR
jgi:hypothetical protein